MRPYYFDVCYHDTNYDLIVVTVGIRLEEVEESTWVFAKEQMEDIAVKLQADSRVIKLSAQFGPAFNVSLMYAIETFITWNKCNDAIESLKRLERACPAMNVMLVHPLDDRDFMYALREIVVDLNDRYKWSREQIADWLESLDIDISFRTP